MKVSKECNSFARSHSIKEDLSTGPNFLRRQSQRAVSCPGNLDNLKHEQLCQSRVNFKMDYKNINQLTVDLPSGGSDAETHKTVNGPLSSNSHKSTPEPSPPFNSESFAKRRASSSLLPPLKIPGVATQNGCAAATVPNETEIGDVTNEAIEHFSSFLVDEMARSGLRPPAELQEEIQSARVQSTASQTNTPGPNSPTPPTSTPLGYKHPPWAKRGKGLRKLADDFAKTRERDKVRSKARGVEAESISWHEFQDLLSELFPRNIITRERIVVLFFFCTDLVIFALQQNHMELFHRFVSWTLNYIKDRLSAWVANQGGWGVVLSASVDYLYRGVQIVGAGLLIYVAYKLLTNATANTSSNK